MYLSNTGVRFSIEKYFRVVFGKLKKINLGFSSVDPRSSVLAVFGTPVVHLLFKTSQYVITCFENLVRLLPWFIVAIFLGRF